MDDLTQQFAMSKFASSSDRSNAMLAEIERLRTDLETEKRFGDLLKAERDALRAEVDGLRADALRYRWLREQKGLTLTTDGGTWTRPDGTTFVASHRLAAGGTQYAAADSLDAAIDAAIAARKP